jgi:hypothetical protein
MFENLFLCGTLCFAPGMRVVEGHVHLGMAHDCLNHSGIFLLVHEERCQRMAPEVVEAESRCNSPRMVGGDGAQLLSCNRMPDEDRISDVQGVKNRDDIISEPPWVITRLGRGGLANPAPRDPMT